MKRWLHKRPWLRLVGRKTWKYPTRDLSGQVILVCTKCGCHFVGNKCPSRRHQQD